MPLHSMVSVFQESISDFYWYYSGKDIIDEQGQRNFSKAIQVAKQVFNTLTEYIQVKTKMFLLFKKNSFKETLLSGSGATDLLFQLIRMWGREIWNLRFTWAAEWVLV